MNSYAYAAFLDELVKIAAGANFALSGVRAITRTPHQAVRGASGALRGQAGNLQQTIMKSEGAVARQQAAAETKRQSLEKMLQSGKVDPKLHDMREFMSSGRVVPKAQVTPAAPRRASTEATAVLKPSDVPMTPRTMPQQGVSTGMAPAQATAPTPRASIQAPPPMAMTPQNIQRVQRPAPAQAAPAAAPAQATASQPRMGIREMLGLGTVPAAVGFGAYQAGQATA